MFENGTEGRRHRGFWQITMYQHIETESNINKKKCFARLQAILDLNHK